MTALAAELAALEDDQADDDEGLGLRALPSLPPELLSKALAGEDGE